MRTECTLSTIQKTVDIQTLRIRNLATHAEHFNRSVNTTAPLFNTTAPLLFIQQQL